MKKIYLHQLEKLDGKYNVGHLVTEIKNPWVTKGEAEEIIDICNSHIDAITEMVN
jgi:hypothetical protein